MRKAIRMLFVGALTLTLVLSVFAIASVPQAVIDATESVVCISTEYTDCFTSGSGFVIESTATRTLIVTNNHVVEGNPISISVWLNETEKINAHILAASEQKDLCILELAYPVPYPALTMKRDGAEKGDAVYAVGFPGAADVLSITEAHASSEATVTDGIVSAIRQTTATEYGPEMQLLQINAAINPGNSGGPLFNSDGFVVGINTYKAEESEGIFGAIAIGELLDFLEDKGIEIEETGMAGNGWIWLIVALCVLIAASVVFLIIRNKRKSLKKSTKRSVATETITLQQFVSGRKKPLTVEEAVSLLMPVAIKLRNLHDDGKPHLEVAPKNIIVKDGRGILAQATGNEAARYTSGYAAPEIYKGKSNGHLSDIYSFCAVLAYAVTGAAPQNSLTREPNNSSACACLIGDSISLPDDLAEAIEKGMELESDNRFDTMQSLIYCLAPYNTEICVKEGPKEDKQDVEMPPEEDNIKKEDDTQRPRKQKKRQGNKRKRPARGTKQARRENRS